MIHSKVEMPLLCWMCLGKNVLLDAERNVRCRDTKCGHVMTKKKWMETAVGSLPKTRGQVWDLQVIIPESAVRHLKAKA